MSIENVLFFPKNRKKNSIKKFQTTNTFFTKKFSFLYYQFKF